MQQFCGALGVAVPDSMYFDMLPGHGFADATRALIAIAVGCHAVSFAAAFLLPRAARADGVVH